MRVSNTIALGHYHGCPDRIYQPKTLMKVASWAILALINGYIADYASWKVALTPADGDRGIDRFPGAKTCHVIALINHGDVTCDQKFLRHLFGPHTMDERLSLAASA